MPHLSSGGMDDDAYPVTFELAVSSGTKVYVLAHLLAVDRLSAGTVTPGEVSSLQHESVVSES